MSIRIVLADDHGVVLDGLQRLLDLEEDMEVVGQAQDGRRAVELACEHRPDVVVLDVAMPRLNGLAAIRQILRDAPATRVIALTMHTSGQIVTDALRAGASGYVVKSARIEEVVQAIRAVAAGKTYLSSEIAGQIVENFVRSGAAEPDAPGSVLSDREKEVLQLVAEGRTTRGIASTLHVSVKTVETHRRSIMRKLDLHNVAQLTKYAIRQGLTPLDS